MSKISIIVPVHNVELYIKRCIDSILSQTFLSFDLILIDDGSTDNSYNICSLYTQKYNNIFLLKQENHGQANARNNGIEYAINNTKSDYLTFIDSDDWVSPYYLEFLVKSTTNNPDSISICSFINTDGTVNNEENQLYKATIIDTETFFCEKRINSVIPVGKLIPITLFYSLRFPEGKIHEDEFLMYKILFSFNIVSFVDLPLYYYFQNPIGTMNSNWSIKRLAAIDAFKEQLAYFKSNGLKKAYISSLYAIITTELKSINSLREYYPDDSEILKAVIVDTKKHIKEYSELSVMDDDLQSHIEKTLYPKRHNIRKIVKKKISNLKEILHIK